MAEPSLFVLAGLVVVGLVVWRVLVHRQRRADDEQALDRLGFRPCPEEEAWLHETVVGIENNRDDQYELRKPRRLSGAKVYYYEKRRLGWGDQPPDVEEGLLFPLKRPSEAGLLLVVKPSSVPAGLASRMLGSVATGPWDSQPDDLRRLELPIDLRDTNIVGALGPEGVGLYDLVTPSTLGVVQGLGDAGGTLVRFRGPWCAVVGISHQIPFRVRELMARVRPLI